MKRRGIGIICVVLSAVIFGFTPVIAALSYRGGNNGVNMALIRALVPLPILFFLAKSGPPKKINTHQKLTAFFAGVLLFGGTLLLYSSYAFLSVGMATTLHFLYPIYVALYEALFQHKCLDRLRVCGIILGVIGIVFCSGIGNQMTIDLRGFGLALVSGFFYAAYILVLSYESRDPMPLYALMLNVSIAGVPLCAVVGWLTNSLTVSLSLQAWEFAAVAALLVSIMGCVLFQKGIRCIGDTDAAAFSLLEPISSIFFGILLMNDVPKLGTMFGSMMIVAGLFFNAMGERKKVCQSQL